MSDWKRWYDEQPTDHTKMYRWRVSMRPILGMELQPEWSDKLHLCGMGYGPNEYWPGCSDWDGYTRTVDPTLEWREAAPDEKPGSDHVKWNGFDLLPSPFTGEPPIVQFCPRYICAPPYQPEWFGLKSHLVHDTGWTDARKMQKAWNTRI